MRALQSDPAQVRISERRTAQVRHRQIAPGEYRVRQIAMLKSRTLQHTDCQRDAAQRSPGQVESRQTAAPADASIAPDPSFV
jgi:hypothetical protein